MLDFTPRQVLGAIDSPVVLLTSATDGRRNIMAANMVMGASFNPVLIAISITPSSYSHHLIEESGEFGLNVAGSGQLSIVENVGADTGSDIDKFEEFDIPVTEAERIDAPLVAGCPASLECLVVDSYPVGEHTLFIGHVVALHRIEGAPVFLYRGDYYEPGNKLGHFFKGAA
ncbi:MAG: flavin reductase family protein [Chloroflexi bacterium]|nr:flavin reductase family protein [Chloroflexota bacterium]